MPPRNTPYSTTIALTSRSNPNEFIVDPSISAGDVKVSIDYGDDADIDTLPVVVQAGKSNIQVSLTADEMDGVNIAVMFKDSSALWADFLLNIETTDGDRLNSVFSAVAAAQIIRVDDPITPGQLSLYKGESRDAVIVSTLVWQITTVTDITVGGTARLTFSDKYCDGNPVIAEVDGAIALISGDDYSLTFSVPTTVADQFLLGTRMTYRVTVNYGASEAVVDAGDVVVA
jgi:hypothetical protein